MDRRHLKAFTLVELVVVISIIGVLMTFVLPSVSDVMGRSRRANAQNCLQKIVHAYLMYRNEHGDFIVNDVEEFALLMARAGLLNDPNAYVFDVLAQSVNRIKKDTIATGNGKTESHCWEDAHQPQSFSVNLVVGLDESCPETTPIAYTRGLNSNGLWDKETDVFAGKGGFVAFLDGHVKWYPDLQNRLLKNNRSGTTGNLQEAIPVGAKIIGGQGVIAL
ncbi:MAG: prepilin-type N-terminal cleavage/methylation domain-containing protein [Opitutales bacterium]|nr:prepilin-type N-terminal cleavage/methylation domain-containing protein [Opitutales bacterium]